MAEKDSFQVALNEDSNVNKRCRPIWLAGRVKCSY